LEVFTTNVTWKQAVYLEPISNSMHVPIEGRSRIAHAVKQLSYIRANEDFVRKVVFVASKELLEMLNKGIAHELRLSIQFMWQHVMVRGIEGVVVEDIFRRAAIEEMKHAEALAERLTFLAGVPTATPDPVHVGHSLDEMLKENVQVEEEAIDLYKQTIQLASKEGDYTTRRMLEKILSGEEEHLDKFSRLLVGMTKPFTQPQL
jgi:bacterioferritin